MIFRSSEKLMNIRLTAAKAVKLNPVFRQIDLRSNQFV